MSAKATSSFAQHLSPLQRRLIVSALVLIAVVVIVAVLFGVFLLLRAFVGLFSGVLWPLAVAGIAAMIFRPAVLLFERRLGCGRVLSIVLLYTLVAVVLGGLIALVVPTLFEQALTFAQKAPRLWDNLRTAFTESFPKVQTFLIERLGEARVDSYIEALNAEVAKVLGLLVPATQGIVGSVNTCLSLATGLAIIPVYLFYFLESDRDPSLLLKQQLNFVRDEWREDLIFLLREFAGSMEAFFRGQILIGLIMGALLGTGFSVAGVNFGLGLGMFIGVLNVIPYFGTILGLAMVLPIAYFQPSGGAVLAAVALAVFVGVQMLEGYVLTPRIMGKQTGLHPLTIIIAIFFWGVALNGLLGMVLAIPLTAFFVVFWRLMKRKYLVRLSG